jgi:HEAT repeat protein
VSTRRVLLASGALVCVAGLLASAGSARARESVPRAPVVGIATGHATVPDDTAALARLLRVVRGVDPLLCELATRNVDMHGWWSRWGPMAHSPLDVDSASAALIRWIQDDHGDPAFVPRLRGALRDSDGCVRRVAASFLARVEHPSADAALLDALDDASADTRSVAALGLGLREGPGSVGPLVRRLRDESPAVRRAAAWALGSQENNGAALQPLIDALERDADPRVRQAAAWALGNIHD